MQGKVKEISDNDLRSTEALISKYHELQEKLKEIQARMKLIREHNEDFYIFMPEYKSLVSESRRLFRVIRRVKASIKKNKEKRMKIKTNSL